VGGLILAWFAIYAISFVIGEYRVAHFLGYLAAVVVALSVSLIAVFITRELLSWRTLGEISRLRSILASPLSDRQDVLAAANEWLSLIPNNVTIPEDARKRIGLFETADEIRGYLKIKISPALDNFVEKYTKASILQMGAMAAISPKVFWDDVATVIRSFILIRQIAKVYGVRPSFSTTLALLRHIMTTAATTMAAASLLNQAAGFAAKIHPMAENFAKKIGIGSAEATRIYQLAVMTAKSCNPLER
jgi:putative membrane protein